jgi:hypothetical protein
MRTNFKTKAGTELPILNLKGKEYLQVAYRIQWMREEHPDWSIETELVQFNETFVVAKAVIKSEKGVIIGMAHKREDIKHFADNIEKAETGSIGRALALCGYGTQFCADDLDEGQRLADSPLGSQAGVRPDQPGEDDGDPNAVHEYRPGFGQWSKYTLKEIASLFERAKIEDYMDKLESYIEQGKFVENHDKMKDFIARMSHYLAEMENG